MSTVLDPRQITRIEAVHRGFLYQHIYAAGCLLQAGQRGVRSVTVEQDEDVELEFESGDRAYIQVKTRSAPLVMSDISGALERFEAIRREHDEQRRPGAPLFAIISNVEPGPELRARLDVQGTVSGAALVTPNSPAASLQWLPPAWVNVDNGVGWCAQRAQGLPMATLPAETLVWKLAGRVQLASAGEVPGHTFQVADLPSLFEQLAIQLQHFPEPPENYRPLENEPALTSDSRVRVITGFSGAGKTAWSAQAAVHLGGECAYYDVGDVPGPAIAANLARELAAQWAAPTADGLRQVLMSGSSGLDSLRALDGFLSVNHISALVVVDNAHRLSASDIRSLIDATRHLRFVLLAQPSVAVEEVEAVLGLQQEMLGGWGLDQAAAEVQMQGVRATATDIGRMLALTGALPLYVRSACQLSTIEYQGDIAAMCSALEANLNIVESAQEIILRRSFDALPEQMRNCVAVMSLSDVPLTQAEASSMVEAAIGMPRAGFVQALRALKPLGVVRYYGTQRLQVHDAFRVLGQRRLSEMPPSEGDAARQQLKELLLESFKTDHDLSRFPLFIRTLVDLGDLKTLVELGTEEFFHELGINDGIWDALEAGASNPQIDPEQRFYALDGLVFFDLKSGSIESAAARISAMELLASEHRLSRREQSVVALKRMAFEAMRGDETAMRRAMMRARSFTAKTPDHQRILQYNIAQSLYIIGRSPEAEAIARRVAQQYFDLLGVSPETIFGLNQHELYTLIRKRETLQDDLKHTGDALDLVARATNAQGRDSGLARIHAMKFYSLANAIDSLIKVAQDLVDEHIRRTDYVGAREAMEQYVLPPITQFRMLDRIVPARGQYAVVLGYCGEYDAADAELDVLDRYRPGLTPEQLAELNAQREYVAELRRLQVRPGAVSARATEAVRLFNTLRRA